METKTGISQAQYRKHR